MNSIIIGIAGFYVGMLLGAVIGSTEPELDEEEIRDEIRYLEEKLRRKN